MKTIIFAGGAGTRLWPLSRKNSPKQFEKLFHGKSTIQLAYERIAPILDNKDIYVSTNEKFVNILREQLPALPEKNFFLEPAKRDLAAAVGLSFLKFKKMGYNGSIAILWADHLMDRIEEFQKALKIADKLIKKDPNRFIFLGEKPRFANHNLGWITVGDKIGTENDISILKFKSWKYRPELKLCEQMFASGESLWNPGYFITSVDFVIKLYKKYMPKMYKSLEIIIANPEKIKDIYPVLESISFDDAIVEKTKPEQAVVLQVDMGWSDPGTLYALKEALQTSQDANVVKGKTYDLDSKDCLVFNYEDTKLVTTVGLSGMIVINMKDTMIVVHKDNVPKVKELVAKLEASGLEKYI